MQSEFEVFVSYSRHDEALLAPVLKLLRSGAHGMVFLHADGLMHPADLWRDRLEDALRSTRYALIFWCAHASASRDMEREYRAAQGAGRTLVPVLLDATPLPPGLAELDTIDLCALAAAGHDQGVEDEAALGAAARAYLPLPVSGPHTPRLTVAVLSFNGQAPAEPLSARFDPYGGSIGRSFGNRLVLPDPKRILSRVHLVVAWQHGQPALIVQGLRPVLVNSRLLSPGERVPLAGGERVQLGGYMLGVTLEGMAAGPGALADALPMHLPGPDLPGAPGPALTQPLLPAAAAESPPARGPLRSGPSPAESGIGLPEDWDPFATEPMPMTAARVHAEPTPSAESVIGAFEAGGIDTAAEMADRIGRELLRRANGPV